MFHIIFVLFLMILSNPNFLLSMFADFPRLILFWYFWKYKRMIKILTDAPWLWYCGVYSQNSETYINIFKLCKTNITCNVTCFPRTWRHKTFHFTVFFFSNATFEMQRYLFSAYVTSFSAYSFPVLLKKFIFVTVFYFPKFSFSAQNLFFLSILQHVIASKNINMFT
jgi:hypothetical protein